MPSVKLSRDCWRRSKPLSAGDEPLPSATGEASLLRINETTAPTVEPQADPTKAGLTFQIFPSIRIFLRNLERFLG
jgi:hypothetical protein